MDDTLIGTPGDDTIDGGVGDDLIEGVDGSDNLIGGDDNDTIYGDSQFGIDTLPGNDTLLGGAGNDSLFGGPGNDFLDAGFGNDAVFGEAGNDTLVGGAAEFFTNGSAPKFFKDTLNGGDGDDLFIAGSGTDVVGGSGIDTYQIDLRSNPRGTVSTLLTDIEVGERIVLPDFYSNISVQRGEVLPLDRIDVVMGSDDLYLRILNIGAMPGPNGGGSGFVILLNSSNVDLVDEGGGSFLAVARGGSTLPGGGFDDTLVGTSTGERLFAQPALATLILAGAGDDSLYGSDGTDDLRGEDGNDLIEGGEGADTLTGGAGNDLFRVFSIDGSAEDVITDMTEGDLIQIDAGLLSDFVFLGATANFDSATGAAVRVAEESGGTRVYADIDGDGAADLSLFLQGFDSNLQRDATVPNALGVYPFERIEGLPLDDTLIGTADRDDLIGLGGNDLIDGKGGDDRLDGGDGNDTLLGRAGYDELLGGADDDLLLPGQGGGILNGGTGDDVFFFTGREFTAGSVFFIEDFGGGDVLRLFPGVPNAPRLLGGDPFSAAGVAELRIEDITDPAINQSYTLITIDFDGDGVFDNSISFLDILSSPGGSGSAIGYTVDLVELDGSGLGIDLVVDGISQQAVNARLGTLPDVGALLASEDGSTNGDDRITTGSSDDLITAQSGNDLVRAGSGADEVRGEAGDDVLEGSAGPDALFGGTGDDVLVGDDLTAAQLASVSDLGLSG